MPLDQTTLMGHNIGYNWNFEKMGMWNWRVCGVSWPELALTRIRRVAPSSLVVPKPRSAICVRARNSSVTMSAALWEIGDPNTLMNTQTDTMSGQAAQPPCAREAVAAELGTIRERVFEARERMMDSERKIEVTLSVA